jgi:hypothetical protein
MIADTLAPNIVHLVEFVDWPPVRPYTFFVGSECWCFLVFFRINRGQKRQGWTTVSCRRSKTKEPGFPNAWPATEADSVKIFCFQWAFVL